MGLGLDRILMLRKGLDDIRLLRSTDLRVARQMGDLAPYHVVSTMPAVQRDLSLVVAEDLDAEQLGDGVRAALGDRCDVGDSREIRAATRYTARPAAAVRRALDRTLTHAECNLLRDDIYAALHRGTVWEWAARS